MMELFEVVEDLTELETTKVSRSRPKSFTVNFIPSDAEENIELLHCIHCGYCTSPDTCVWGVVCPECNSAPKELCTVPGTNGRYTGLHEERWRLAKGIEYAWR